MSVLLIQKETEEDKDKVIENKKLANRIEGIESESPSTLQIELQKAGTMENEEDLLTVTKMISRKSSNNDNVVKNEEEDTGKDEDENKSENVNINDIINDDENNNNNRESVFDIMKEQHKQRLETEPIITHPSDNLEMEEISYSPHPNILDDNDDNVNERTDQQNKANTKEKDNSLEEPKLSTGSDEDHIANENEGLLPEEITKSNTKEKLSNENFSDEDNKRIQSVISDDHFQTEIAEGPISNEKMSDPVQDDNNGLDKSSEQETIIDKEEEIDTKAEEEKEIEDSANINDQMQHQVNLGNSLDNEEKQEKDDTLEEETKEHKENRSKLQTEVDNIYINDDKENKQSTLGNKEITQEEQTIEVQEIDNNIAHEGEMGTERFNEKDLSNIVNNDSTSKPGTINTSEKLHPIVETDPPLTEEVEEQGDNHSDEGEISSNVDNKNEEGINESMPNDSEIVGGKINALQSSNTDTEVHSSVTLEEEPTFETSEISLEDGKEVHEIGGEKNSNDENSENEAQENFEDTNKSKMNIWDPVDYTKYSPPGSRKNSKEEEGNVEKMEEENLNSNEKEEAKVANEKINNLNEVNDDPDV